jgi:hypothetical protein
MPRTASNDNINCSNPPLRNYFSAATELWREMSPTVGG